MSDNYRSDLIEGINNHRLKCVRMEGDVPVYAKVGRPVIVCLCGSTKFYKEFLEANERETLAGKIVLSVGLSGRHRLVEKNLMEDGCMGTVEVKHLVVMRQDWHLTEDQKTKLDKLHLWKIDIADEVLILNVGGYIGESTRRELEYAKNHGKVIRFLEEPKPA